MTKKIVKLEVIVEDKFDDVTAKQHILGPDMASAIWDHFQYIRSRLKYEEDLPESELQTWSDSSSSSARQFSKPKAGRSSSPPRGFGNLGADSQCQTCKCTLELGY